MLKRFQVSNFKQFNSLEWNFSKVRSYDFSRGCLTETSAGNFVKTALVFGRNSSGKSNLGLAVFDILQHLSGKAAKKDAYTYYANADHPNEAVKFSYTFLLDGKEVVYSYSKISCLELSAESLLIDGNEVFSWNKEENIHKFDNLPSFGFESPNFVHKDSQLSFLSYLADSPLLQPSSTIRRLVDFVRSMRCFSPDKGSGLGGLSPVKKNFESFIIRNGLLEKFENFLNEHGVKERLKVATTLEGREGLYVDHEQALPFLALASSGTLSLTSLFYWREFLKANEPSLIYIDDFDAFYDNEVAKQVFGIAKTLDIQCILTTHNTNLLTHANTRADCCFLLRENNIRPFSDLTTREIRQGNNLEKLFLSHEFEN